MVLHGVACMVVYSTVVCIVRCNVVWYGTVAGEDGGRWWPGGGWVRDRSPFTASLLLLDLLGQGAAHRLQTAISSEFKKKMGWQNVLIM